MPGTNTNTSMWAPRTSGRKPSGRIPAPGLVTNKKRLKRKRKKKSS